VAEDTQKKDWHNEKRMLSDLIPYEKNPRKITDEDQKRLKKSFKNTGYAESIAIDTDNVIVAGHQRYEILKQLNKKDIEIDVRVPPEKLTEQEFKDYLIASNKDTGEWDYVALAEEFTAEELLDKGFDEEEFKDVEVEQVETEGDDEVPETPEEPKTVKGDLYELGEHRVLCGDATVITDVERLMDGDKADMVFADPPYGYKYESNYQNKHKMLEGDDKIIDFMPVAFTVIQDDSPIFVCTSHQVIEKWKPLFEDSFTYKNLIVWKKNNWSMGDLKGAFAGQHELILFGHKGRAELNGERKRDVWEFDRDPPANHPTQKPIDLIMYAIKSVKMNGDNVLDVFGGSGSTLIACEKTKRRCYMMELDPNYCDVIVKRYKDFCEKNDKVAVIKRNGEVIEKL